MDQSGMPKLNPAREPLPSMRDPGQSSGPAPVSTARSAWPPG